MIPSFKSTLYKRKFVALFTSQFTQKNLMNYCLRNNLDISYNFDKEKIDPYDFDFHTTIMYSATPSNCYLKDGVVKIRDISAYGSSFELFGENNDVLVLKLIMTKKIENMRKQTEKWGLSDKWPEYKPHITLSYKYEGTQEDINKLQLPTFELVFNKLHISQINEDV